MNYRGNTEPTSAEMIQDSRLRRATFHPTTVDRLVIKGSMSKMVVSGVPMARLLR